MPKVKSADSLLKRQLDLRVRQIRLNEYVCQTMKSLQAVQKEQGEILLDTLQLSADINDRTALSQIQQEAFKRRRELNAPEAQKDNAPALQDQPASAVQDVPMVDAVDPPMSEANNNEQVVDKNNGECKEHKSSSSSSKAE